MANKPVDYYAGYPGQQKTPKWVGVAIGSLFGGMTLVALAIGIRMVMPSRTAEASMAPAKPVAAEPVAAEPAAVEAQSGVDENAIVVKAASQEHAVRPHAAKASLAKRPVAATAPKAYKKAQVYAKSVSSSRHNKRARDELDKMLGL